MILYKKFDVLAFLMGKKATGRKLDWNQATENSKDVQMRVNFKLPPFIFADVKSVDESVDMMNLDAEKYAKLGVIDYDDYIEKYGDDGRFKKYLEFENIRINPEFPFADIISVDELIEAYKPFMYKSRKDLLFNTRKLTCTALINKIIDVFYVDAMSEAYNNNDSATIVTLLDEIIDICHRLGFKEAKSWENLDILPYSLGNSKIGEDTLCISINSAMLCYMGITGNCDACGICYASNSNRMYTAEFLKNSISQRVFIDLDVDTIINNTIKSIETELTSNEVKNLKFLRFNVNGDILNNAQLIKLDKIAEAFLNHFDLKSAYTYTHNKQLNQELAQNIVINSSFMDFKHNKQCLIAFEYSEFLHKYGNILCDGDCNRCSYCKNPDETRTIFFLAHGGKYEGVKAIPVDVMAELKEEKEKAYIEFMGE